MNLTVCCKTRDNGLRYEITGENTVKVEKAKDNLPKGKVVIPSQVKLDGKTYTVTAIGSWGFFGCKDITEVVIPNTITDIDIWAFTNCEKIAKIDIPSTVTHIGYSAFEGCSSLTSITIPSSIKMIDERLCKECDNLTTINLPPTITSIGMSAFSECKKLETIVLPDAVTTIGAYAFAYNDALKYVGLPASLRSIGHEAFSCCQSLTTMDIPEGTTQLGYNAFNYCKALESITLPSTLTYINGNPFSSCRALKEINVRQGEHSLISIDGIIFSNDMTKLITCPPSHNCGNYTVPASVKEIMPYAFYDCSKLTGITMTNVERIGESAFHGTNISTLNLGNKLKSIEKAAFYSCNELSEVFLPDSVQHLGMNAFDFCHKLLKVSLAEKLTKNEDEFNNTVFQFNSKDLKFIVRKDDGTTETLSFDQVPVVHFPER